MRLSVAEIRAHALGRFLMFDHVIAAANFVLPARVTSKRRPACEASQFQPRLAIRKS
jgi:hypothetical protein